MKISDKKRRLMFITIIITGIASSLLSTAMTAVLPAVAEEFQISLSDGQWLTSGYSLAMAIMMPMTAFLITKYPIKKLYAGGIGIFILGLLCSIFATDFAVMMLGRVLQAGGNGVLLSAAQVVIMSIFPEEKKGSAMGWYGLVVSATPIIAPTIAGIMVDIVGWKSIFWVTLAIMLPSLVMTWLVFKNVLELQKKKFDVISFILSIFVFGGLTLGIGNITSKGITAVSTMAPLLTGIFSGILFVRRQMTVTHPFLNLRILAIRNYRQSVVNSMLLYFIMMGSSVMMPLYVQRVMGYSATVSGFVTMPGAFASALISPFAGKIYDRLGIRRLYIVGGLGMVLSNIAMCFIGMETPLWIPALLNVVRCTGIGCTMMPLFTWGVSSAGKENTADASALLTSFRTMAGSIGAAVFVGIMTSTAQKAMDSMGEKAMMYGLNVAFAGMTAGSLVMLLYAVFMIKDRKK